MTAIGLKEGHFSWQQNRPHLRGINHVVQVVRRPVDQASFASESYSTGEGGVRLTALADWLGDHAGDILAGEVWAVDVFALADPFSTWVKRARGL